MQLLEKCCPQTDRQAVSYQRVNYTEITEVNLSAFPYRLFQEDVSSIDDTTCDSRTNLKYTMYELATTVQSGPIALSIMLLTEQYTSSTHI